jgi:hypothetical protein
VSVWEYADPTVPLFNMGAVLIVSCGLMLRVYVC